MWLRAEARIGQQGARPRIWALRPSPARAAPVMLHTDTAALDAHLAELSRTVAEGAHAAVVRVGAGWHGSEARCIPDTIGLPSPLPYACAFDRIETVWAYLRAHRLANSVFEIYEAIVARCCDAWTAFATDIATDIATVRSIPTRAYARAVRGEGRGP